MVESSKVLRLFYFLKEHSGSHVLFCDNFLFTFRNDWVTLTFRYQFK